MPISLYAELSEKTRNQHPGSTGLDFCKVCIENYIPAINQRRQTNKLLDEVIAAKTTFSQEAHVLFSSLQANGKYSVNDLEDCVGDLKFAAHPLISTGAAGVASVIIGGYLSYAYGVLSSRGEPDVPLASRREFIRIITGMGVATSGYIGTGLTMSRLSYDRKQYMKIAKDMDSVIAEIVHNRQ